MPARDVAAFELLDGERAYLQTVKKFVANGNDCFFSFKKKVVL